MNPIPFAKVPIGKKEYTYLTEVLKSGWLTTSAKAHKLEDLFAGYLGVRYACAVNSCTAAMHLALEAIGIKNGDKVLVPAMTFTATAEVIRYLKADPVFADVEYRTSLITPEILSQVLNSNRQIKAAIPVHFGGQALEMTGNGTSGIAELCRIHNVRLIEDAAHAFPARHNNQWVGTFGDVACFSFYANKTITTGEGGMLVTNDQEIYNRAKIMRLHGIDRDAWNRFTSGKPSWEYDVVAPGFKYNMPDLNAAVGIAQFEKADAYREQRQRCALMYYKKLSNISCLDLPVCKGALQDHAWHLFPVIIKPEAPVSRNRFIELMAEKGIGTSVHYKPLYRMTYYRQKYNLDEKDFPNAERIWKGTVSLPIYPGLTNTELNYICSTIKCILTP